MQISLTSRHKRIVHAISWQCRASSITSARSLGLCLVASIATFFATAVHADDPRFSVRDPDAPLRAADRPTVLAAASLDDYVGTYKLDDKLLLKVFRMDDGLFAQASGQNAFPIFPSATDAYYTKVAGISISFTRDGKGIVTGLVLHQNGDHAARKLSASESPPEPVAIALDAATLGDYVGKYKFDFGAVLDVALKSDHLEAQLTGQPALPIFASAKDKFFYKVVAAQLDFERDGGQKVVAVVLHQNGRDMRAPRVGGQR
jgi:D-alanyl-D-alanine-carboxypeptidase/D-alanyl-D-alanine-endopeptidase